MGVGHDDAGVDREALTAHDPFLHAARDHGLEQLAQKIALAETRPWRFLENVEMIGNVAVETARRSEPAISQIEVDLVAQPPL